MLLARGVGIGAKRHPRGTGTIIVGHPVGEIITERRQMAFLGHVAGKTRLREDRDVRRVVRTQVSNNQGREVAGPGIFDHSAGCLFKTAGGGKQIFLVLALHGPGNGDHLALEFTKLTELRRCVTDIGLCDTGKSK